MQGNVQKELSLLGEYWDQHPRQQLVYETLMSGDWIPRFFGWLFMIISKLLGYAMTIAVAYLVFYVMILHGSLGTMPGKPTWVDNLASLSDTVINIGPELVLPGLFVITIKGYVNRKWLDASLYTALSLAFFILTLVVLKASIDAGGKPLDDTFLQVMLFWRVVTSLAYTLISELCGSHGPSVKLLLRELETLRNLLGEKDQSIIDLQSHETENLGTIERLKKQNVEYQETIRKSQTETESIKSRLVSSESQSRNETETIRSLRSQISEKSGLISERDRSIRSLEFQVSQQNETINKLNEQIKKYQASQENETLKSRKKPHGFTATDDGDTMEVSDGETSITASGNARMKLKEAWESFIAANKEYTYQDLADTAQVSLSTVKRLASGIKEELGLVVRDTDNMQSV